MSRDTKDRVRDDRGMMSWAAMWAYFMSSYCTDEMRKFTMQNFPIVDYLDGAVDEVQIEILQYAPKVLINHPAIQKVLHPSVRSKLGGDGEIEIKKSQINHEELMKLYRSVR